MRQSRGFTLIEICASLAILGVMAMFFSTIYQAISVTSAQNARDQEVQDAVTQLRTQFSEFEGFCATNFAGTNLSDALPAGDSVAVISRLDAAGNRVGDLFRVGSALRSGVVVDDIRLVPTSSITSQYLVATLALRMRRPGQTGGPALERAIPIYAAVNGGRVVRCSAIRGNIMQIRDEVCRMQNGGFASYDAVGDSCVDDPRIRWIPGSLTVARCPAGYRIAFHPDDPSAVDGACTAQPRGVPVRARTYTNGETWGGPRGGGDLCPLRAFGSSPSMNAKGFSLLEIAISQAALMVVILAFAALWALSQQGVATVRQTTDLALKVQEVRDALKREAACTANFLNTDLSLASAGGSTVNRIAFVTPAGVLEKDVVVANQEVDGHRVSEIRLRPVAQVDQAQISAVIEMTFQRSGLLGPSALVRSVGVLAQVRQGKVQKCRLLRDGALSAGKQICVALSGGALDEYDPILDECALMNGKWILGSSP